MIDTGLSEGKEEAAKEGVTEIFQKYVVMTFDKINNLTIQDKSKDLCRMMLGEMATLFEKKEYCCVMAMGDFLELALKFFIVRDNKKGKKKGEKQNE